MRFETVKCVLLKREAYDATGLDLITPHTHVAKILPISSPIISIKAFCFLKSPTELVCNTDGGFHLLQRPIQASGCANNLLNDPA